MRTLVPNLKGGTMADTVTVKIENTYEDGHESTHEVLVEGPELPLTRPLDEWWEEVVFPHTGDGHAVERDRFGYCYTATVIATESEGLLGRSYEWVGS